MPAAVLRPPVPIRRNFEAIGLKFLPMMSNTTIQPPVYPIFGPGRPLGLAIGVRPRLLAVPRMQSVVRS